MTTGRYVVRGVFLRGAGRSILVARGSVVDVQDKPT